MTSERTASVSKSRWRFHNVRTTIQALKRRFTKSLFTQTLLNGENVSRDWLLYSPSTGTVFCFVCCLFGENECESKFSGSGFNDWKHSKKRIAKHESSQSHRHNMIAWINRTAEKGQVDFGLRQQFESESQYWTDVLRRVVAAVKFLSQRGLAFRGTTQAFGTDDNGNYLGCLELISEFDPFLREHISGFGNSGKGHPSYLSASICEEFIQSMGEAVLSEIVNNLKLAKYFSISVDSTRRLTHRTAHFYNALCVTSWNDRGALCSILAKYWSHGRVLSRCYSDCFERDEY